MDKIPKPGECYRHFKNKLYQIITVAIHTETDEKMVVYQALYGTFRTYVRPLSMFLSQVDREKYPDVKQEYRFIKVNPETETEETEAENGASGNDGDECEEEHTANENLIAFLDARSCRDKLKLLRERRERFTEDELLAIGEVLEIACPKAEAAELYRAAESFLEMQNKFDGARLR